MTRSTGQGSGMMIMVILILLLSSSASAGGGYFYTNREDTKEAVEDEFKKKYQEATRALEAERAAQQNVNVAKSVLELAQEELELARLAFEGKEFANEAEKSAARARLYAAEQDVDTAAFRLSEAETDAQTASTRRDTAEKNANSALEIAITINTMIEANAVADANVMVTLAQGQLDAAERDWARIIGDANAAAANVMIASDAQAYAAYSRLQQAQNNYSTASTNLQTTELELTAAQNREAAALIGAAEKLSADIGAGNSVTCSINDVGGGDGAVYFVDGITNVLRHYPNSDIAASWDPNWATATSIDCVGFALGKDMVKNPAVVAAEAFQAKVDSLGDGTPVRCSANDVGAGQDAAVYRTTGTATLRHYETADIAASWDPNWASAQSIDCAGFGLGAPMPMEPGAVAAAAAAAEEAKRFNMPVTGAVTLKGGKDNQYCIDTVTKLKCISTNPGAFETYAIEQHGDKYAIKSGRNDKYCKFSDNASIFCSFSTSTDNTKFDIEGVGDGKYALKYNGKYCADEGDGGILCNRDSVGEWEKFTLDQAHPVPKLMRGEISWQDGGAAERGGLIWKSPDRLAEWNTKYKFRCAGNGGHSVHGPEYGPVSFGKWGNPKIRVALNGQRPCPANYKLEIFEGDENITSQMKNFDELNPYDGYDAVFYDSRIKHSSTSGGGASSGGGYQLSDPKLKDGINKIGTYEGLNVYEWTWNDIAMTTYGLKGREIGFLTTELDPKYVGKDQYGYEYIKDGTKISEAVKTVRATMK